MLSPILESENKERDLEIGTEPTETKQTLLIQEEILVLGEQGIESCEEEVYYDSYKLLVEEADNERTQTSEGEKEDGKGNDCERIYDFPNQRPRRQRHYRTKQKGKQLKPMPEIRDETHFLMRNKALDCVKEKVLFLSANREHNAKTKQE